MTMRTPLDSPTASQSLHSASAGQSGLPMNETLASALLQALRRGTGPVMRLQVKRFVILACDLSEAAGELTLTGKVKRSVVYDRYGHALASMYDRDASTNGASA